MVLGWKVLRPSKSSKYGMYNQLEYKKGLWTRPHKGNGPLVVFKKKIDAERFVKVFPWHQMKKCKYIPSIENVVWYTEGLFKKRKKTRHLSLLPHGSILAKRVKILE